MIPYARQSIDEADIAAVLAVLQSDWLTQGPAVPRFEQSVADYCGAPFATAVGNGTMALHLACLALGVGPGDRVWTSPNTFVASANCARYCGADVDFVDIDADTLNLSPAKLADKLHAARREGRLPKVVIPVHFAGRSCDMTTIHGLSHEFGFRIIEDAAHALGATHAGERVGGCRFCDVTTLSFHPVKHVTSGEGGMLLTRDPAIHAQLVRLRTHGITRDPAFMHGESEGPWYYEQVELGFNYRMTNMQAAIGLAQTEQLEKFVQMRRANAAAYSALLASVPGITTPPEADWAMNVYWMYGIMVDEAEYGMNRDALRRVLADHGIETRTFFIPMHCQPVYWQQFKGERYPVAEDLCKRGFYLPSASSLSIDEIEYVTDVIRNAAT